MISQGRVRCSSDHIGTIVIYSLQYDGIGMSVHSGTVNNDNSLGRPSNTRQNQATISHNIFKEKAIAVLEEFGRTLRNNKNPASFSALDLDLSTKLRKISGMCPSGWRANQLGRSVKYLEISPASLVVFSPFIEFELW